MTRSLKLRTGYGHGDRALHGALGGSMHDGDILFYGECHCFGIKQNPFFCIKNVKPLGADHVKKILSNTSSMAQI